MRATACASPGKAEGGTGRPPPKNEKRGGRGGGKRTAHSHQTACQHHKRRPNPPPRRHQRQDPKERHRGTTQPKPATPRQEQRPVRKRDAETCRHTTHGKEKKREPAAQHERKGMRGQGPQGPGQGQQATDTTKPNQDTPKKKRKKHTPTTQPRRAGHSRDPGPARTPTHRTPARKGGEQAGPAHKHALPHSTPNQEVQETTRDGRTSAHTPQHPPKGEAGRSRNENPSMHAHTAHRNRKWQGASGARTQPHTSHKQAKT